MKFGNIRNRTSKKLSINIGVDGIGEEVHPKSGRFLSIPEIDPIKEKILSIIEGNEIEERTLTKHSKLKLYLNTFINLLINRKKKFKNPLRKTIHSKIVNWWRKEKVNDAFDLVKFILIHGVIVIPTLLGILTITNLNIPLIQYIRGNIGLTMIIYTLGGGSFYYLFLDVNLALKDTWRKRGRK